MAQRVMDDIERYRDPEKLYQELDHRVSLLKKHLSRFSSFRSGEKASKTYHLLNKFLADTRALTPLISQLDFSTVPANGLRSCLRLWMKYLDTAIEMQNEVKVQNFVTVLAEHLCLWPALIDSSVACMLEGHCEASSRERYIEFYSKYYNAAQETLINRKVLARTFDITLYPFLLLFLRAAVWTTEPSLKRRILNQHYLTYRGSVRSLCKRLSTVTPESSAAWIRSADWFITRTYTRLANPVMHPLRNVGHRLKKKKFNIECSSRYCIKQNSEGVFLTANDGGNNNNNNNVYDVKASPSVSSSLVEFFTLKSGGRGEDREAAKKSGEQRNGVVADGESDQSERLFKSKGGRCAFFSQKEVQSGSSSTTQENDGKILIYIHGGAFFGPRSSSVVNIFIRDWSQRLPGVTFVVPEYSYCPEVTFPVAWQEILDLYIWLVTSREASDELQMKIDPSKVVLAGDSAGALLASSLLVMVNEINRQFEQNIPIPRQVILSCPKLSLRLEVTPSLLMSNYDLLINGSMLAALSQAVVPITRRHEQTNQKYLISPEERKNLSCQWFYSNEYQVLDSPILSPLSYDRWNDLADVNLNIIVATFDPLLDDGVQFAKAWRGSINVHIADNVCHASYYYRQFSLCSDSFNDKVLRVIKSAIDSL